MSVKSFVNSREGRAGIIVALLALGAVALSAGFLWWLLYLPKLGLGVIDQKVLSAGASNYASVQILDEENPLIGLPSNTLTIEDNPNSSEPATALTYAAKVITEAKPESLVNTHIFKKESESKESADYDFMFYSGSLSDYSQGQEFDAARKQFDSLLAFGAQSVNYSSKPISSGGREITISLKAKESFTSNSVSAFQASWSSLISQLGDSVTQGDGSRIDISVKDASGVLTMRSVLNDEASVERATNLDERLWHTFDVYLNSNYYDFLDARSISYSVERTSEDSVMSILTGDQASDADEIVKRMWAAARDSGEGALFPGSYITYVMAPEQASPLVTFPSSSRNW